MLTLFPSVLDEIWRDVPGSDGQYSVSSLGRLRTNYRHRAKRSDEVDIRTPSPHPTKGYCFVTVTINGRRRHTGVHQLVALAFVPNPEGLVEVNHVNGIKTDNVPSNLEWTTRKGNLRHAWNTGLMANARQTGTKHHRAKMDEDMVRSIRAAVPDYTNNEVKYRVAAEHGISICTVNDIVKRRSWRHVI